MQALLDDLGSAKSMYREMYETSKDSAGSALKENEIYMKSLEARINLTKVEFEKLAVSIGDAFLTDGMVAFLQVASGGLGVITKLVDGVGLLPVVLGTAGMATFALSSNFRTFSANAKIATTTLLGFNGAQKSTDMWNKMLTVSTRTLGVAWKGFLASLGVGIPLIIVGVALEKLMSKMGDARQKAEELESQTKQTMDSYKSNKDSISKLANEYAELEKVMSNGDKSKSTLQKHAEVADELGKVMPSLVQGEDTYGRKVVGSSDAVKVRVEMLQRQLEIQEKIAQAEAREKRDDNIDTYEDSIKASKDAIDSYLDVLKSSGAKAEDLSAKINNIPSEKRIGFIDEKGKPIYQTFKDVENGITKINGLLKDANDNGDEESVKYYTKLLDILNETYQTVSPLTNDIIKNVESLRLTYSDSINDIINRNSKLDESAKETAKNLSLQLLNAVNESDLNNVKNSLENLFSGVQFSKVSSELIQVFSDLENASEDSFGNMKKSAEDFLSTLPNVLKSSGMKAEDVSAIMEILKKRLSDVSNEHDRLAKVAKENGVSIDEARAKVKAFGDDSEGASESVDNLASKMKDFKDATESMAGVSQSGVDALNDLILKYDMLTYQLEGYTQKQLQDIYTKENLTSKERDIKNILDDRVAVMKEMSSVYPDLLGKDGKAIFLSDEKRKAIEAENKASEILLKGYKNARDGKLSAEEQATLASASGARARINNLRVEIDMLEKYVKANTIASKVVSAFNGMAGLAVRLQQIPIEQALEGYKAELSSLTGSLSTNIGKIDSFNTAIENSSKSTKSNTKAQKDNNAEKEKSIWITDKYKQKLEELNLAIEKQQKIQSKFPEYSSEYKKSLETQIKLEKQKLELQQKQAKAIESQIASGKIQQTGNISVKSPNGKINGYEGKITSTYGSRADNHRGVDIAMPTGTRVDAPVSGKVIKAGSATSDKNGKKMDWTYGNLVVIQDDNDVKHILAHLDQTIVKLGDQVQAGTQIGKSGNTGYSTGAHLHYEQNNSKGQTINPTATLNAIRSSSATTPSASSQQAVVWNYFKNKGLNDKAIAGLMGNIAQESNFNSSAVNKSSGASGIFQWLGGRKTGLQDYAKSVGKSWTDLQVQLDYAWKELNNSEKKALSSLQRSDLSSSQHASEFERLFERSGGSAVGKRQNFANQYYNQFAGTNGGAGVGIDTSQQAIDQANSDLNGLNTDILQQEEAISNLEKRLIDITLSAYEHKKSNYDKFLENSDNRLNKLIKSSQMYRDELDKQINALTEKKKINQAEIVALQNIISSGNLTSKVVEEYTERLHELGKVNSEIDFAIKDIDTSKLESYVSLVDEIFTKYNVLRKEKDTFLEYENIAIEELDTSSLRYLQTLEKINSKLREKQNINRQELTDLELLIKSNKLSGEALENTKNRVTELNSQIKQLQLEIQNGDFNIIVNIKTQSDADISKMQFEIDRNEAIRKMYEEGSADYKKYTENILKQYEKMAQKHLETRDALVEELKQRDITAERIKEVKKLLEDEHLAYLNATLSIKEYTKQVEKANESQLKDVAEKFINAHKEYVQERKDEHMKSIDEEIKRENEKHEKIMKQLNDEMDLFRKNVDEKLRLIERQEAERDYNMQIGDMEKERDKLQSEYNLTLLDKSNEAKQKRKKLQEQLDKIDKDIAEKRHERDIELQKQGLNDLLETKEDEINGKIELQDKEHENTINKINREKEYWEKHYTDLLNDERKFARIREDILAGHFDKVLSEFDGYIAEMIATMPELEDTLNGTMQSVGTSIRQNVIDHLREAISLVNEFNSMQVGTNGSFGDFNPNDIFNENKGTGVGTSKGNLTQGDMKVLLGKFLTDNVANQLSGSAKESAHTAGNSLGSAGRVEGSTVDKNISFDNAVKGLTSAELEALNQYFTANKSVYGGQYEKYINNFLKGNGSPISGSDVSGTDKYGLGNTLTNGDMQVLMAKYVNDVLLSEIKDTKQRTSVKATVDKLASDGRNNGMSKLDKNISFGAISALMSRSQANQLKDFMTVNSGMFGDATLQSQIKKYAASLDTGGFMNWSGTGMDGKGGKAIIAHPNEIMLNKVDTKGFFKSIDVMDRVMSSIRPILSKFSPQPIAQNSNSNGDVFQIQFGDVINATKEQAETYGTTIANKIRREKGGKW
ncbi:phage tail tip lysozyme [Lysinibacillus sp. NPDC086135]|uniref:phage tail tip lysozyme n=1 Tax=Lysinibacillus sp. NPDC086135 TaxID=3364130 RepID=UPI00381D9CDE